MPSPPPAQGTRLFAQHCAGCHGADAHSTDHGPPLSGSATLRKRSISQLRNFIHDGMPAFGMPAFELPADQLDALAALAHSLWHFPTNGINKASPMTYTVGGKQFIALAIDPNIIAYMLPAEGEEVS